MRFALLLTTCCLAASPASAQDDAVRTIPFDGLEVFCHILRFEDLQPVATVGELMAHPKESMVIVLGSLNKGGVGPTIFKKLSEFEKLGGNTLVALDHEQAFSYRAITITGTPFVDAEPARCYRGNLRCPLIRVAETSRLRDHPIFRFLSKPIATNCPSSLIFTRPMPKSDFYVNFDPSAKNPPCCMTGSGKNARPEGRTLFIAGHGLFMNGMMLQSDNDNFNFAINVVRWLKEGPNGSRTRAMLIVDGEVVTDFNVNLSSPPRVPMPPIKAVDRLLHGLEKERLFHRILDRLIGNRRNTVLSVLFAATTFLLLLYGAKKLLEGRYHLETAAPRMVGELAAAGSGVSAAKQRQIALFRQATVSNEARLLARAWIRQEFGIQLEQWDIEVPRAFRVNSWFWGGSLQKEADRVLQLASAAEAAPLTRREFARLLQSLPRLGAARRSGRLALVAI